MPVSPDTLDALANSLQVVRTTTGPVNPGEPVPVRLNPDVADLRVTDTVPGKLDLALIAKDVRFDNADTETLDLQQLGLLNDNILDVLSGTGVTGLLRQVTGTIPIPVQVPVRVEVTWAVLADDQITVLQEGEHFLAPDGLSSPQVSFVLRPEFTELTTAPPPVLKRFIRATVVVSVGSLQSGAVDLPLLPVFVPAVPVPTVAAFFRHSNFQPRDDDDPGAALVVVPPSSPIRSVTELQGALDTVDQALRSLRSITSLAGFLLGLGDLVSALPAQPHVQFRSTAAIDNLNDITLIQNDLFTNDIEAEDELSSLILIGPSDRSMTCFNARDFDPGEGRFRITLGPELYVLVKSLHSAEPTTEPAGRLDNFAGSSSFGDSLSSVQFDS